MIAKICDICGTTYEPYGTVIEQENEIDPNQNENEELINDSTLENDADYDFSTAGEEPEINGFRYLTIDEYGTIQYGHQIMDMCPTCRDAIVNYIDSLRPENNS